jgi:hypothetical protein
MNLNLKLEEVREEVLNLLGAGVESEEQPAEKQSGGTKGKSKTPALDSFGRDLTELAARASSTRSSGARTRSSASSRSSAAARRTTPSSSARPASARRRSSRAWPR